MEKQICCRCKEKKEFKEFYKNKSKSSGFSTLCIVCKKHEQKIYYIKKKEYIYEKVKKWRINNVDRYKKYKKDYSNKNKEKIKTLYIEWCKKNKEKFKKYKKDWIAKNPEKYKKLIIKRSRNSVDNITDGYIIQLILNNTSLSKNDIPNEMLEAYRQLLKLKREIKNGKFAKYE